MSYDDKAYAPASAPARAPEGPLQVFESEGFAPWLAANNASLSFTTYQAGKIVFVGANAQNRISIFERSFPRCMGLGPVGNTIWMSSLFQLWRMENFLDPGKMVDGYDAVFVPVNGHTTGEIDVHDIAQGPDGRPVFVATRVNCIATLDDRHSFVPIWKPPFIDKIIAEDRCHLNGAAFVDGAAQFVTCVAMTNVQRGWSDRRRDGGTVLSVPSGEIVVTGLSMPHSPRLYDGKLWLIQSGTGEFGYVDQDAGRFVPVCDLPGFSRGLAFLDGHAVIGVSRPRKDKTFEGLELDNRLGARGQDPICAILAVNLETGKISHMLQMKGAVQELYDVAVLPGIRRPMALGFMADDIRYSLRPGPMA
ncbi:MAG: TIGR03032 family protein [Sedimentitalea sp.]